MQPTISENGLGGLQTASEDTSEAIFETSHPDYMFPCLWLLNAYMRWIKWMQTKYESLACVKLSHTRNKRATALQT